MSAHQFKVGDPVVCIDAEWHDPHSLGLPCPLIEKQVYHIAAFVKTPGVYKGGRDHIAVSLREVENRTPTNRDIGFALTRFRPVAKRATDISIFTALLTPSEDDKAEIELLDYELERPFQ